MEGMLDEIDAVEASLDGDPMLDIFRVSGHLELGRLQVEKLLQLGHSWLVLAVNGVYQPSSIDVCNVRNELGTLVEAIQHNDHGHGLGQFVQVPL